MSCFGPLIRKGLCVDGLATFGSSRPRSFSMPRLSFPHSGLWPHPGRPAPCCSKGLRRFSFLFNHFSVRVSDWIIVIGVFSGSLVPSSAAYNLPVSPSGKCFNLFSDIVFLTSRNTILHFYSFHFSVRTLQLFTLWRLVSL